MYIDNILKAHEGKQIGVYTKSGHAFRGYLSRMDEQCHIAYISKEMSGQWLTMIDTRNIESLQIEEGQLDNSLVSLIHKEA